MVLSIIGRVHPSFFKKLNKKKLLDFLRKHKDQEFTIKELFEMHLIPGCKATIGLYLKEFLDAGRVTRKWGTFYRYHSNHRM
jgi:hypothetical protein